MLIHFIGFFFLLHTLPPQDGLIQIRSLKINKELVIRMGMSDEFNRDGRRFKDGNDPMWTALDKSDDDWTASGRRSVQFYNSSYVRQKSLESKRSTVNKNNE